MLNPEWYFEPTARKFIAFANSDSACSRYDFTETGVRLRKSALWAVGSFGEAYMSELKRRQRIGVLSTHLNIQDALKRGKLSDLVVAELRGKVRA